MKILWIYFLIFIGGSTLLHSQVIYEYQTGIETTVDSLMSKGKTHTLLPESPQSNPAPTSQLGYRIMIESFRTSEEAEKLQRKFFSENPILSCSIVAMPPLYKVLVGDYLSQKQAQKDVQQLKKNYPKALVVSSKIWLRNVPINK